MSSKRKFSEVGAGEPREHAHGRQLPYIKRKQDFHGKKPTSIAWIKKRARTIERSLNHKDTLPANVRHDLEKELDHHKQKLDDHNDLRLRKQMIKKYHMVRFFERKKADRLAKQLRKQLAAVKDEKEMKKLQADLHITETDSLYAKYYPHRERYVSLYPVASADTGNEEESKAEDASSAARFLHAERPPLWKTIEEAAEQGTRALVQIQERKQEGKSSTKPKQPAKQSSTAKAGSLKAKATAKSESSNASRDGGKRQKLSESAGLGDDRNSGDDDSDGGFFEDG